MSYVIAIDCGTTGTRAMLYDLDKNAFVSSGNMPIKQIYPHPAWVEQNASEIYANTLASMLNVLESAPERDGVLGIGITNQRETVIAWNRRTGQPVCNAIVWQCRRTAGFCEGLRPHEGVIAEKTGLVVDPYFSASKIKWLFDNVPVTVLQMHH